METAVKVAWANPQFHVNVNLLKEGYRWCVGCGTVCIKPGEPSWKIRCVHCWLDYKNAGGYPYVSSSYGAKFCGKCGERLGEGKTYTYCSKACLDETKANFCACCKVWHPKHYHA